MGGDSIRLELKTEEKHAVFVCSNGIKEEEPIHIERVFTRFYKANMARTENSSGLGLAIAHELTQKMNGGISADLDNKVFSLRLCFKIVP